MELRAYRLTCPLVASLHNCVPVLSKSFLSSLTCLPNILVSVRTGRSPLLTGDHVEQVSTLAGQPTLDGQLLACTADHDGLLDLSRPKASEWTKPAAGLATSLKSILHFSQPSPGRR